MDIVNMRKVGNKYEPESIDMDPFSDYKHPGNPSEQSFHRVEQPLPQPTIIKEERVELEGIERVNNNIDQFFDGVDMFFSLTERVMGRIGGPNARRRKSVK